MGLNAPPPPPRPPYTPSPTTPLAFMNASAGTLGRKSIDFVDCRIRALKQQRKKKKEQSVTQPVSWRQSLRRSLWSSSSFNKLIVSLRSLKVFKSNNGKELAISGTVQLEILHSTLRKSQKKPL